MAVLLLPFFSEVWQAECSRRLVLSPLLHADDDQNEDGDDEGCHLVDLLDRHVRTGWNVQIENVQRTEQERSQNADIRSPDSEDNQRDGQPSSVTERVVGPHAGGVVHDIIQSAESCNHGADAGRPVLVGADVDAGSVRSRRVLTDSPQLQALSRPIQEEGGRQCDHDRDIDKETIVQKQFSEHTALRCEGKLRRVELMRDRQRDGRNVRAGQLDQRAAEEVAEADAEGCHRKAGHVLVCAQCNRQEAVQKSHQERAEQTACKRNRDREKCVRVLDRADLLLVEKCADDAGDRADVHDARNTEVQVSALFRERLACGAKEKRSRLCNRTGNEGYNIKHSLLRLLPEHNLVLDKELASDQEEDDDRAEDIRKTLVQAELRRDLACAL